MIPAFLARPICWRCASNKQAETGTLVLGLGNTLRADDGIGAAAIAALREAAPSGGVELLDGGTPGLETVLLFEGYARVIIVDAAQMGLQPGAWRRFTPQTQALVEDESLLAGTLHAAGLAEALALAGALDKLPPELVIYGVQPQTVTWREGLSPPVQAALPALCAAVREELSRDSQR